MTTKKEREENEKRGRAYIAGIVRELREMNL